MSGDVAHPEPGKAELTPEGLWQHLFGAGEGYLVTFTGRQSTRPDAAPNELDYREQKSWPYPGEGRATIEYLAAQSADGRDAYFGVHLFSEEGSRKKKNAVELVWALWMDGDGAKVPEDYPQPTAVVASSPGREHFYWRLSRAISPEQAENLNKRLAYALGADRGKWSLGTVLRTPQSHNYKRAEPTLVSGTLTGVAPHELEDIDAALPPMEEVVSAAERGSRKDRGPSPKPAPSANGEPPVRLSPSDREAWEGTRSVSGDSGGIDRSRTLHWIACGVARGLRRAGVAEAEHARIIEDAVEERDMALGYDKYSGRADSRERYAELADEAVAASATDPVREAGANGSSPSGASGGANTGGGSPGGGGPSGGSGGVRAYRHTDYGNAERLVARHGHDLHYLYAWSQWFVWDGRRWALDTTGEVERRAKETVRSIYAEAANAPDDEMRKAIAKHAQLSESRGSISAMIAHARSEPGIPVEVDNLDTEPYLLNAANGTIDLRTGNLHDHDRSSLITKLAPVEYDTQAEAPTWASFLAEVLPSPEVRSYLQKLVGYALTGTIGEHILPILHGVGANGKSTLLNTILKMMGDYALQAASDLLVVKKEAHPTEQADLFGRRLVTNMETEDGKRFAESRVKQLTGGDKVRARRMREDFWEFSPTHTLFLATNHKPEVRGTDHAIWRRLRLIPFEVAIPSERQDKHLEDKLRAELPGILRWAVEGCLDWQRDGLGEPPEVMAATQSYREEMDILAAFLADRTVISEHASALATPLYREYCNWCEEAGERAESQKKFGARLVERGFISRRRTRGNGKGQTEYIGLGILSGDPSPEPPESEGSEDAQDAYKANYAETGVSNPSPSTQRVKDREATPHRESSRYLRGSGGDSDTGVKDSEAKSGFTGRSSLREHEPGQKVHYPSPFTAEDDKPACEREFGSTDETREAEIEEALSDLDNTRSEALGANANEAWDAAWAQNIKAKAMAYIAKYAPSGSELITEAVPEMDAAEANADAEEYLEAARRACREARRAYGQG